MLKIRDLGYGVEILNGDRPILFAQDEAAAFLIHQEEQGELLPIYIYNAELLCPACAQRIRSDLDAAGLRPDDMDDETTYDSDDYPKGPFPPESTYGDEHCGSCGVVLSVGRYF